MKKIYIPLLIVYIIGSGCASLNSNFTSIDIDKLPLIDTYNNVNRILGYPIGVLGKSDYDSNFMSVAEWNRIGYKLYSYGHYIYQKYRANNIIHYDIPYILDNSKSNFNPEFRTNVYYVTFDKNQKFSELARHVPDISQFNNPNVAVFQKNKYYSGDENIVSYISNEREDGKYFRLDVTLENNNEIASKESKVKTISVSITVFQDVQKYFKKYFKKIDFISLK